jgi:hypothetical protein
MRDGGKKTERKKRMERSRRGDRGVEAGCRDREERQKGKIDGRDKGQIHRRRDKGKRQGGKRVGKRHKGEQRAYRQKERHQDEADGRTEGER